MFVRDHRGWMVRLRRMRGRDGIAVKIAGDLGGAWPIEIEFLLEPTSELDHLAHVTFGRFRVRRFDQFEFVVENLFLGPPFRSEVVFAIKQIERAGVEALEIVWGEAIVDSFGGEVMFL